MSDQSQPHFFNPHQRATVAAAMARIIPTDDSPGATEADCVEFVDRYLSGVGFIYAKPDGSGFETLTGPIERGWRQRIEILRRKYSEGIEALDHAARSQFSVDFVELDAEQAGRNPEGARERERPAGVGRRPARRGAGAATDLDRNRSRVPALARDAHATGLLLRSDLRRQQGPRRLGLHRVPRAEIADGSLSPGASARCPGSRKAKRRNIGRPIVTLKTKPSRTEVCIIGAGASGAAAAKVLTERGVRVVALERGPWRGKETFGGDELANINRYNLWPDPLLNPRTARTSPDEKAHLEMFCPVPQMVGGGTVHWQGWLPRFTPNDFRIRTVAGEVKGATLADWPIAYDELEPYYAKVEWAFGVSGRAGANKFEGPRSNGLSLSAAAGLALCREIQQGLRRARLECVPDAASGAVARVQRPQADGDQRLRATAWRPHRHPLQRAERLRARRCRRPAAMICAPTATSAN